MKRIIAGLTIPFILQLFSCKEGSNTTNKQVLAGHCTCEERKHTDTVFFATKVQLQEVNGQKVVHYHCADIAIGIASVSDEDGAEHCENLYELECVSPVKGSLVLSDSFTYFLEEMDAMKLSSAGAQNLFFEALTIKKAGYFKFTVVNKELKAISKINIQ